MKKNKRIFFWFLIFVFASIFSVAQTSSVISEKSLDADSPYSIQTWNTENGLPQNSINDICQTDDGYLWIATFGGIARFDGIKFTLYNTSNNPELKDNQIKKIFVANNHQLFALTAEGKLFRYQKNIFSAVENQPEIFLTEKGVISYNNASNELFLVSHNNQLYRFSKGVFTKIILPQKIIINEFTVSDNQLFIASDKGLFIYADNKLTPIPALENSDVNWITQNKIGVLYGHSDKGFFKLRNKNCTFIKLSDKVSKYHVYYIGFDDNDNFTLLTHQGFVELADSAETIINTDNGLPSNKIFSIFKDRQNNLWIGTYDGGLCKLNRKIARTFLMTNADNENDMTGITQLKNGTIVFSNFCGGMSEYNEGKITHLLNFPEKNICIYSIAEDAQSTQWITTYGHGVYAAKTSGEIKNYTQKDGLASDIVFVAYTDKQGIVWLGTNLGLCYIDHNVLKRYDAAFSSSVEQIMEDASGRIFVGAYNGFGELENGKIKWIKNEKDSSLTIKDVNSIYEDADGTIWLGSTGYGLFRYKNGYFFSFLKHTNALGINESCILEDEKNNFWMGSNSGMYVVNKANLNNFADNPGTPLNIRYLSKEDGIINTEFNGGFQGTALKTKNNLLFFPTVKGLVEINPKLLSTSVWSSKITIEKISANAEKIDVSDTITLSSFLNQITVKYTIPYFNSPNRIEFQYQLSGYSDLWINVETAREIMLTDLPSGNFILRIRTINMPVNTETDTYIIHPPAFWKSEKFIFGAVILFLFLIVLITLITIKRIEKREKQKTLLHQKYANIELKALQTQLNPHFIFNCLNAIQHFVLINDEISASKYLTKFSTLMRKYLEHSKFNHVTLQEECDLLRLYIELEYLRFNKSFDYKFVIAPEIDVFNTEIPSMLFQPFVENAINHGLLNLGKKGLLTVSFKMENDCIVGIVDDDGKGRQYKKNNFQNTAEHKSRGMEIISDRIEVLNSMENKKIKLQIIDKKDANGFSLGTSVRIDIPT